MSWGCGLNTNADVTGVVLEKQGRDNYVMRFRNCAFQQMLLPLLTLNSGKN